MAERQPSEYFGAPSWEPVCVVGGHDNELLNAQICVSIFSASIVPEKPRIAVILWKPNLTHDYVQRSKTFAVTLLDERGIELLTPLGLMSGHEQSKLEGIAIQTTTDGDPYVSSGVGFAACRVVDSLDLGDATLFVGSVNEERRLRSSEPMTWQEAQELVDEDFMARYRRKFAVDTERASREMRW